MGGRDWFQALVSAMGIPAVTGSDSGCDTMEGSTGSLDGSTKNTPEESGAEFSPRVLDSQVPGA